MKIKYKPIIFLLLILMTSCKDDVIPESSTKACCFTYEIDATFNGQKWERSGWEFGAASADRTSSTKDTSSINYKCLAGLTTLSLGIHNKSIGGEGLVIGDVSKTAKKYSVALIPPEYKEPCGFSRDSITASFYTVNDHGDATYDSYNRLSETYSNAFEVVSYEPVKNEFNCRFDFAFIKTSSNDKIYPDTIYLKGKFRIEGRLKQ
jgi:hypothetical protein